MPRPLFDSEFIHGLHDPGGEDHMVQLGRPGWVLHTFAVGRNPDDQGGFDFRPWSDRGLGVIARLNHGYHPDGTLPASAFYGDFARRCANFVSASPGCAIWVIGNEMNYASEQPPLPEFSPAGGRHPSPEATPFPLPVPVPAPLPPAYRDPTRHGDPERFSALHPQTAAFPEAASSTEVITPERYVSCYKQVRQAIRSRPGHGNDQVIVGGVAPWNNQTSYPGNPNGDWVKYFQDILRALGPTGCDGISIHTYTHGTQADLVESEARMNPPFQNRHFHFRTYRDWMEAVPANMQKLPVYLTEMDQDDPWLDENNGWVQRAYAEINGWNARPGAQQIRCALLYRWPQADRWFIDGKGQVIEAFRQAVSQGFRWRDTGSGGGTPPGGGSPPPGGGSSPPGGGTGTGGGTTPPGGTATLRLSDLAPGALIRSVRAVNLRRSPGFVGKPASDVLTLLPVGTSLTLLAAARTVRDGLGWRLVRAGMASTASGAIDVAPSPNAASSVGLIEGWVAETAPGGASLVIGERHAPPLLPTSEAVVVSLQGVNVRRSPGYVNKPSGDVVTSVGPGTRVRLIEGPVAADRLSWWRIGEDGSGGLWMAETAPNGNRFLASAAFLPAST